MEDTFDGLLSEKVVVHNFNRWVQGHGPGLLEDFREILQDQTSGCVGPLATELGEVVAHTASHINQEGIFFTDGLDQGRHIVEAAVHPARTSLMVRGHVVVELASSLGVLFEEVEEVKRCLEAELESAVGTVGWVLVAGLLQLGGEGEDTLRDTGSPGF
jgi:NTP pyrophosphatase (non-canonical NTP hydrolase)